MSANHPDQPPPVDQANGQPAPAPQGQRMPNFRIMVENPWGYSRWPIHAIEDEVMRSIGPELATRPPWVRAAAIAAVIPHLLARLGLSHEQIIEAMWVAFDSTVMQFAPPGHGQAIARAYCDRAINMLDDMTLRDTSVQGEG